MNSFHNCMNLHQSDLNSAYRALLWCMLIWYTLSLMLSLTSCPLFLAPLVSQLFSLSSPSGVHASTSSMEHMKGKWGTDSWLCYKVWLYMCIKHCGWLTFINVMEDLDSDIYPDSSFCGYLQSPWAYAVIVPWSKPWLCLFMSLQFSMHSLTIIGGYRT